MLYAYEIEVVYKKQISIPRGKYQKEIFERFIRGEVVREPTDSGARKDSFKQLLKRMKEGGYEVINYVYSNGKKGDYYILYRKNVNDNV